MPATGYWVELTMQPHVATLLRMKYVGFRELRNRLSEYLRRTGSADGSDPMSLFVFAVVILGALLHAGWNALA